MTNNIISCLFSICVAVSFLGCSNLRGTGPKYVIVKPRDGLAELSCFANAKKINKDQAKMKFELRGLKLSDIKHIEALGAINLELVLSERKESSIPYTSVEWLVETNKLKRIRTSSRPLGKKPDFRFRIFMQDGSETNLVVRQVDYLTEFIGWGFWVNTALTLGSVIL